MYVIKTEDSFDAAHFLAGYQGKCSNIHGHRWRVEIEIKSDELKEDQQFNGMVTDFSNLKEDLKEETEKFDHMFIIEENSLKETTKKVLEEEGFLIVTVPFRPTAENFSKYFYEKMSEKGYAVRQAVVYETPANGACYYEEER